MLHNKKVLWTISLFIVFLLLPVTLYIAQTKQVTTQHASFLSGNNTNLIYFYPSEDTVSGNQPLIVNVRTVTRESINAIQANIHYPAQLLHVTNITYDGSSFDIQAEEKRMPGLIKIARGVINPVSGDNLIATITFTPIAINSSIASLSFTNGTAVVDSTRSQNILEKTATAVYNLVPSQTSP